MYSSKAGNVEVQCAKKKKGSLIEHIKTSCFFFQVDQIESKKYNAAYYKSYKMNDQNVRHKVHHTTDKIKI